MEQENLLLIVKTCINLKKIHSIISHPFITYKYLLFECNNFCEENNKIYCRWFCPPSIIPDKYR